MPETLPMNPRTAPGDVSHYGIQGAEWIGADGERYRTSGQGFGMYRVRDVAPVPGMLGFWIGRDCQRWVDEINTAVNRRDAGGAANA